MLIKDIYIFDTSLLNIYIFQFRKSNMFIIQGTEKISFISYDNHLLWYRLYEAEYLLVGNNLILDKKSFNCIFFVNYLFS